MATMKKISAKQKDEILKIISERFAKHMNRHPQLEWKKLEAKLKKSDTKLATLYEMEITGGEPDVVGYDKKSDTYVFFDCAAESPAGRRSLCFDRAGLESRKEHQPLNSAMDLAAEMGVEILDEKQYRELQTLGKFDTKTSSWIATPANIRKLGGALFADYRYGTVFVYHNGAQSYYAGRGFRGFVKV